MLIFVNNVQMATLLLIPIGLLLYGTYSPAIVLGQNYLPNRVGLSSGVTLGVAVAIGGDGAASDPGRGDGDRVHPGAAAVPAVVNRNTKCS